ncbi:MAG: DUF169 domain-containing protein [Muribaculaceae bacterium]|nr:DUF169 domain-containing protein [Muribaculaceae bacterium]
MTVKGFIEKYRQAFGEKAPLPIAFGYSDTPVSEIRSVPKCLVGSISNVRHGNSLTLSAENVICGGGGLYTAFTEMPERVPIFVSEVEHYKKTKEMVVDYVQGLNIELTQKPYLNFVRIDNLKEWSDAEALLFFATPDILAGLSSWAFYDNNSADAVVTQFSSGCASIVTRAISANKSDGRSCFIGMLDPSARPLIPENELTFTIPMCRLMEMLETMDDSSLYQKAFSALRRRINR